ncbi:MAG: DUF58 domain-containing protein [Clostridia bacterium]|nr:DUF58 domain-containing protein [Deltaproteobacteria bacterium]
MSSMDAELSARARHIRIGARRVVDALYGGAFLSAFKGQGIELDQVREYQPGDDVRRIDWNVTARAHGGPDGERAFVKEHRAERELTVQLLIDVSASGSFGSGVRSKDALARELGCVLALAVSSANDRVGVTLFSETVEHYLPPAKGRTHTGRILCEVDQLMPRGKRTSLASGLAHLQKVQRRRAVVILISDLLAELPVDLLRGVAARHELKVIRIVDARERTLPDVGLLTVRDAETQELAQIDTGDLAVRLAFERAASKQASSAHEAFAQLRVPMVDVDPDTAYIETLARFLRRR